MKSSSAFALFALLAVGCSEDSLGTTPPAAVDVTGTWSGTWQDHPTQPTASGDLLLTLLQGQQGAVEGTLTMGNLPCVATHPFTGQVTGLTLEGSAGDETVVVTFFVDARGVPEETPSMKGDFQLTGGEECTVPEGRFTLGLDIVPLTFGATPPFAEGGGSWRGLWLPQGEATPLALDLETGAAGELHGLLELEGARLALLGAWTREGLSAAAPGAFARISARFESGEALEGQLALEGAEGEAPRVGRFHAAPRR